MTMAAPSSSERHADTGGPCGNGTENVNEETKRAVPSDDQDCLDGDASNLSSVPVHTFPGMRHLVAFLGFLGFVNVYSMRVNLSVAIVAMVNSSAISHVNTSSPDVCPLPNNTNTSTNYNGEFAWTEEEQGIILGSFFWGYIATNILGGRLAENFGGHIVMGVGVGATSVLTLLTPYAARSSVNLFIALRVAEGLTEGLTFPAMMAMLAVWTPPLERTQTVIGVFSGAIFGTVLALPASGYLCSSTFLGGWPAAFYIFGAIGVLWLLVWAAIARRTPEKHPWMSDKEKLYIGASLRCQVQQPEQSLPVPYRAIFTSMPFYAIAVCHMAQNYVFYVLLTELPTYLNNILHFDIKQNSLLSALPYFAMFVFGVSCAFVCDFLRASGRLTTTQARLIFSSIGMLGPAVFLVAVAYTGCDAVLSVTMLTLAVGLNGATGSGHGCAHLDIAPNFGGTLMGITNTVATVPAFLAPLTVGALISGQETLERWRLVFWLTVIIIVAGNTFFVAYYRGELQPWNEPNYEPDSGSVNSSESDDDQETEDEDRYLVRQSSGN
ncbi:sialin isoform X1 [Hyalella azteca]|uniref:Sialin n=1 Tax=Hyalella azteca TaxID=294128 RepID=A0A8B7NB73_HYAAZ|nr:sialin isoform X1 [Hyalella azteca]